MIQDGDVLRVACRMSYSIGGDDIVNTHHVELYSGGPISDALGVVDLVGLMEMMYSIIVSKQASLHQYVDIAIKNITQDTLLGIFPWATLIQGTGTGVPVSGQVAALVFGRTALSRVQMRKYIGGLQEEDVSNGGLVAAVLTPLLNFGAQMIVRQAMTSGVWDGIAYNALLDRRTLPVSAGVSSHTRTQRRRTFGRGS